MVLRDDWEDLAMPEQQPISWKIDAIYTALVNVRNTELSVYYARYNILAVINIGLIAAVLATRHDSRFLSPLPCWIVLGGCALSLVWLGFAALGKRLFTERWEVYLRRFEREILDRQGLQPELQLFTHVESTEQKLSWWKRHWENLNVLTLLVPLMAFAAWIIISWTAYFAEPLDSRVSRLEASTARLQQTQQVPKEVLDRFETIENEIHEILKLLPHPATDGEEQAQPQSPSALGQPR
jgi:hypothetical protein